MTAFRSPRGGQPEGSGGRAKHGDGQGAAHAASPLFRSPAAVTLDRSGDFAGAASALVAGAARAEPTAARSYAVVRSVSAHDPMATARAQSAFETVWNRWQCAIDAVTKDRSLMPEQRAAAIYALRQRQAMEAAGARRQIIEEERRAARERRLHQL